MNFGHLSLQLKVLQKHYLEGAMNEPAIMKEFLEIIQKESDTAAIIDRRSYWSYRGIEKGRVFICNSH